MRWGAVDLKVQFGAQVVTKRKAQIVRHYPGTDRSDKFDLGRQYTEIAVRLFAEDDAERVILESLMHDTAERDLEMDAGYHYKRVVTGEGWDFRRVANDTYEVAATFIALDPAPYDSSDNPLY